MVEESTLVLTYAGMGLAVMMLGLIVFIQGTVLEHPEEQVRLGQRVRTIGNALFAVGLAYVASCLILALV